MGTVHVSLQWAMGCRGQQSKFKKRLKQKRCSVYTQGKQPKRVFHEHDRHTCRGKSCCSGCRDSKKQRCSFRTRERLQMKHYKQDRHELMWPLLLAVDADGQAATIRESWQQHCDTACAICRTLRRRMPPPKSQVRAFWDQHIVISKQHDVSGRVCDGAASNGQGALW